MTRFGRLIDALIRVVAVAAAVVAIFALIRVGDVATQANNLARSIQGNRLELIRQSCVQQNKRNAATYQLLRSLPHKKQNRSPSEYRRLLRQFTDAVAGPARDCDRVVEHIRRQSLKQPESQPH